ncbi:LPXTG-domain-containing protein cell wall anchor domain [Granulicatella elegans ATCC 700633]|uniref:LPXTG-domain-containing protein cell wall anchor domain n=1 Tax=Granulicatella elegans ATCC 700633 TaxID=626369 RepID=D0BND9_9LACT|nr:LPXTG-domain-containing protein cell wall anchor domain [Granulicatella elegans ATCC 700633]
MKPTRITTAEGKVYELVPASTKGNETGDVEAGKTTEVTYVYKEVKENDKNKNLTPNNPAQPAKPGEETPNNPAQPAKQGEETPNNPAQPAKPGEETPNNPAQPAKPGEGTNPATPGTPAEIAEPGKVNPEVATGTTVATKQQELPNTGTGNEVSIFGAAATAIFASLGLLVPGKKRDEE